MVTWLFCFGPKMVWAMAGIMAEVCSLQSDSEVNREEKIEVSVVF